MVIFFLEEMYLSRKTWFFLCNGSQCWLRVRVGWGIVYSFPRESNMPKSGNISSFIISLWPPFPCHLTADESWQIPCVHGCYRQIKSTYESKFTSQEGQQCHQMQRLFLSLCCCIVSQNMKCYSEPHCDQNWIYCTKLKLFLWKERARTKHLACRRVLPWESLKQFCRQETRKALTRLDVYILGKRCSLSGTFTQETLVHLVSFAESFAQKLGTGLMNDWSNLTTDRSASTHQQSQ